MQPGLRRLLIWIILVVILVACGGPPSPSSTEGSPDAAVVDANVSRSPDGRVDRDAGRDVCGDGVRGITEACDDRNTDDGDGCSADCLLIEPGHRCPISGQPCIANRCSDRRIDAPETCEDGNDRSGDGCSAQCQVEAGWDCPLLGATCGAARCGDGLVAGREQCDDGNASAGDGCSHECVLEAGWKCPTPGQPCQRTRCGDGMVEGTEQCDNDPSEIGALPASFDGCDSYCRLEPSCTGGTCEKVCGDGILLPIPGQEACDDGNVRDGDGCAHDCTIEQGYACTPQPSDPPASIPLPLTIRDVRGADLGGGHPDFEAQLRNWRIRIGIVGSALTDGRPTFNRGHTRDPLNGDPTEETFASWYTTSSYATTLTREIMLERDGDAKYTFDSGEAGFFPIDDAGWTAASVPEADREPTREDGVLRRPHNFSFTTETRFWFQYNGTETLTFSGDDDLWVYIDGMLCLDVGGVHPKYTAVMDLASPSNVTVTASNGDVDAAATSLERAIVQTCKAALDETRARLGYSPLFEVRIFHAERHTSGSNFRLELTNFVKSRSTCSSMCGDGVVASDEVCDLGPGRNDGGYNGCVDCRAIGPHCGDQVVDAPDETCDDGVNAGGYDACGPACTVDQYCGDGIRQPAFEECDVGTNDDDSGCTAQCRLAVD